MTFAGQGFDTLGELGELCAERPAVREWVAGATDQWVGMIAEQPFAWSGLFDAGVDVRGWVERPAMAPPVDYLTSSVIAQPLILITQVAWLIALHEEGLGRLFEAGCVEAVTGHSQGILPAVLVAESVGGRIDVERALLTLRLLCWQGLLMRSSFGAGAERVARNDASVTPMIAISGPDAATLQQAVDAVNRGLAPEARVELSLLNTRTRHVVSGPRDGIVALTSWLTAAAAREARLKQAGRFGGQPLRFTVDPVPTDTAFHSSYMAEGLEGMRRVAAELGWRVEPSRLRMELVAPSDGASLNTAADPTDLVLEGMHVLPVRWPTALDAALGGRRVEVVLDLGPGDGVARLTRAALRGRGVRVLALTTPEGRSALLTPGQVAEPTVRYADFAPAVLELAQESTPRVDNPFTRFTGRSPVILPGMTPTTADVGIVAAAANAGFCAELAGGGQVSERVFWLRMEELAAALEPGQEVVFNALHLDPYLWDLHLRKQRLVFEARRRGYPICGVTISAGIPAVGEAVALLDELVAAGIWLNAFKPGTPGQVKQVIEIARAARHHTICVQLEGGKAGGHHAWEDLDQLLLETLFSLRSEPNVLVCVGGGVGTEARAAELLTGRWAHRYGEPDMPVDAILLGTVTMACAEAETSPAVKAALVEAAGTASWVFAGAVEGGVTSGKSQLNADIHYLDNAASRCGRLLDAVAGKAEAVEAQREAIIAALNATVRPYVGDLEAMSYRQLLDRLVELMAIGRHGRYEDGVWLDPTWRQRFIDMFRRAEARLSGGDEGAIESLITCAADVDDPAAALDRFEARYGARQHDNVEPADALFFVRQVCARPGKPVPFVPVIDADVRRWYKADSLWQAHDDRFAADAVLVIPGPEAVAGILRVDEPVAALLGRFEAAVVEAMAAEGRPTHRASDRRSVRVPMAPPAGIAVEVGATRTVVTARQPGHAEAWFDFVASQMDGPASELFRALTVFVDGRAVANPVRRLCAAVQGAEIVIENDDAGAVLAVTWRSNAAGGESVRVVDEGGTFAVDVATAAAAPLSLRIAPRYQAGGWSLHMEGSARTRSLAALYHRTMFGADLVPASLFDRATAPVRVEPAQLRGYRAVTGGGVGAGVDGVPLNAAFSLIWQPLFAVLSAEPLAGGILDLVHLSNAVEKGVAWPPRGGELLVAGASVVDVEDRDHGRVVRTVATLSRDGALVATVRSGFFIRGDHAGTPWRRQRRERVVERVRLESRGDVGFLLGHPFVHVTVEPRALVDRWLEVRVDWSEDVPRVGAGRFGATGELVVEGHTVGRIALDSEGNRHPLGAMLESLGAGAETTRSVERKTLGTGSATTPQDMAGFAQASGDLNPIHRSAVLARLAGLQGPIVHGMWMAARLTSFVEATVAPAAIERIEVDFVAMAQLGESVELEVVRSGVRDGAKVVEATMRARRDGGDSPVCRLRAFLSPSPTAYVFPGQGIQQRGMGMDGYARSRAARRIWERADSFTRAHLGFSILRIVRDNPRELLVHGVPHVHPRGVLNLTQFTQVAMAVLAQAQVAELREQGLFVEAAVAAGHSVGEYNALAAVFQVLPLESQVELVYQRGCTMHTMVPRDADGQSGYGMGVVRPHYARLDHAGAEALVAAVVAETGEFVQIVNYNVDGRQYSVTGTVAGLARLEQELARRTPADSKPAWIEVPGIDVPFHSKVLVVGVPAFRTWLDALLPAQVDHRRLVGRYVPNLVARMFELTPAFVQSVLEVADAEPLRPVLADFEAWAATPDRLARVLLVELLAWQFASPVRWIETQRLLLAPTDQGGVSRLVEIGVGYQPTLANMARYTLDRMSARAHAVTILNVEAERDQVFMLDQDAPAAALAAPETSTSVEAVGTTAAPPAAHQAPVAHSAAPVDRPFDVAQGLLALLAVQARVRPEQISLDETIDELFDGVSSRRNQVLMDLGAEFGIGTIDGAHERPLRELIGELNARAAGYNAPGRYLVPTRDEALRTVLGRTGLKLADVNGHLAETFGLGPGLLHAAAVTLALETRSGDSVRGGALGRVAGEVPRDRAGADALLNQVAAVLGERIGHPLSPRSASASAGSAVDAAVVRDLEARILGRDGALGRVADALDGALGRDRTLPVDDVIAPAVDPLLATAEREYGRDHLAMIQPRFEPQRHAAFTSAWAWAQRDVAALYYDAVNGRRDVRTTLDAVRRLAAFAGDARVARSARWFAERARTSGHDALADALSLILDARNAAPAPVAITRPSLTITEHGHLDFAEVPVAGVEVLPAFVDAMVPRAEVGPVSAGHFDPTWRETLVALAHHPMALSGKTALVTGASPGSIAVELVRHLLRGGARVVVTTTRCTPDRLQAYRELYQAAAVPGAELHVVPFNQASASDVDALVDWLFDEVTEQAGATVRVVKRPWAPDLVLPFGAIGDSGTLDQLDGRSEAALRGMLVGVERLIARIGARYVRDGVPAHRCHVLLPLSPNHGVFGGDGFYAESKAALEVLTHRWRSERSAWGAPLTLCAATIGWVRGTGLMDQNNPVASELERRTGVRTFSGGEMGFLLASLCGESAREASRTAPLRVDLTGRFLDVDGLDAVVSEIRAELAASAAEAARVDVLRTAEARALGAPVATPVHIDALPHDVASVVAPRWEGEVTADLTRTVVIVATGELGPCGSGRTRHAIEVGDTLAAAAVVELAWMTGLIRFEAHEARWVDVESGDSVPEGQLADRYREAVLGRVGLRWVEPETVGFDPEHLPVMASVFLERDFTFPVASEAEGRGFVRAAADDAELRFDSAAGQWVVVRKAGSVVRVPRTTRLRRHVAGLVPRGFDFARFGVGPDMVESVDRTTLFNLVATVDAWISAGVTPEELFSRVHPARVANTQGSGIGGMGSIHRLYTDHLLERPEQSDVLQETLINVIAAYVVQAYVGNYGPMAHPVGACATAAVSLEEGMDKILAGKADFVVAGGYDDIGPEGMAGFEGMNATCDTDAMTAMGFEPHQMSRPNDARRRGFVEAQGGGTALLARGDVALELGLPVVGVLGWAGSFGDGIHKSIPAPGLGILAAACGGTRSPLGSALAQFGLSADDVAVVYKHDTSTNANDPNENELHHRIQVALGRSPGNPLWVASQKALTGHSKGGSAAWQLAGLCQTLQTGLVAGNRNLESVDEGMRGFEHMAFTDQTLRPGPQVPLRAGLLTSLGFGHVSAIALVLHRDAFLASIPADRREVYLAAAQARTARGQHAWARVRLGLDPAFEKRNHRRFAAPDGSDAQREEEIAMLLDPTARLDLTTGTFRTAAS